MLELQLFSGNFRRRYGLNFAGLQRDRFQLLSPEAFATQLKYRGVVKDTVKRAEQGRVLVKILSPKRGILVARKYHVEVAFLVVSPVNQIKEQTCILPVKGTVTIRQLGRTRALRQESVFPERRAVEKRSRSSDALMK